MWGENGERPREKAVLEEERRKNAGKVRVTGDMSVYSAALAVVPGAHAIPSLLALDSGRLSKWQYTAEIMSYVVYLLYAMCMLC